MSAPSGTAQQTTPRFDRFKFTKKRFIAPALLADEAVIAAVREHAALHGLPEATVWRAVRKYIDEIVPAFNPLAYAWIGIAASRALLNLFYRVNVSYIRRDSFDDLPPDSIVIYLINHRSNADYVFSGYALAGQVAISYAVGEWARVFPLEYLFKSFGSYFIRRRFREPLYHTVLERYVQLVTRNGVTQGIFPEGGLTRDGKLRPAKIGLLDYALGIAREPGFAERMYLVPVGINFDRVLEDRSLLRELGASEGKGRTGRLTQLSEVLGYAVWNTGRLLSRTWKRYGEAALVVGEPIALAPWFNSLEKSGRGLFAMSRTDRLGVIQALTDDVMERVGEIIPVTPVPLVCAAIQTFDADFITRASLLERMLEVRESLLDRHCQVLDATEEIGDTLDRAYELLRLRRVALREGAGYFVLPRGRELISYYANSIAHLLGEFASAVRARDALPVHAIIDF